MEHISKSNPRMPPHECAMMKALAPINKSCVVCLLVALEWVPNACALPGVDLDAFDTHPREAHGPSLRVCCTDAEYNNAKRPSTDPRSRTCQPPGAGGGSCPAVGIQAAAAAAPATGPLPTAAHRRPPATAIFFCPSPADSQHSVESMGCQTHWTLQ